MNGLLQQAYAALLPLPAALTRGWPQAIVPLPSITLEGKDDRLEKDGERVQSLQVSLRAALPEEADQLAALVEGALQALDLRRTGCRDGAEKDSGAFLKLMGYELRSPAVEELPQAAGLLVSGQYFDARILLWEREMAVLDLRSLADAAPRLESLGLSRGSLLLRLPAAALPLLAAGARGQITPEGLPPIQGQMRGFRLKAGYLEVSFDETL
ncbi:MAG: hypothetical protein AB9880_08330 [Christensenellales bacterium]